MESDLQWLVGKFWGAGSTLRSSTADSWSLLPWNVLRAGVSTAKYPQKVRDEMKARLTHEPRAVVLRIRTFNAATPTVTSRARMADWVFEVFCRKRGSRLRERYNGPASGGKSWEMQHKEPSTGSSKWTTLKLMTPSPPLMLMWEGRNNRKIIRSEFQSHEVSSISKGHLLFITSIWI